MVVIRLARHGSKHKPFYHVTVADRRARRDGAFIERVGFYNPIARGQAERLRIDLPRVDYWVGQGAQASQTVGRLIKEARLAEKLRPKDEAASEESNVVAEAEGAEEVVEAVADSSEETSAEDNQVEASAETEQVDATSGAEEVVAEAESSEETQTEEPPKAD